MSFSRTRDEFAKFDFIYTSNDYTYELKLPKQFHYCIQEKNANFTCVNP